MAVASSGGRLSGWRGQLRMTPSSRSGSTLSNSGPGDDSQDLYLKVDKIVPNLVRQTEEEGEGDFWVDEKGKQVYLSEAGQEKA